MKYLPRSLAILSAACVAAVGLAVPWKFIVAGDGRGTNAINPDYENGVNKTITNEIAQACITEGAKFLLWTGDLAYGDSDPAKFKSQLLTWRTIMAPLYAKGIRVLPVRGNHENRCMYVDQVTGVATDNGGIAAWNEVFSGRYALPADGPVGEKNLSFTFAFQNVLVIGLDQYGSSGKVQPDPDYPANKAVKQNKLFGVAVNQPWLDGVLAANTRPFVFAYGHEPAFVDGHHLDGLDDLPAQRNSFWDSLIKAGSRAFFCGHDHVYDHMMVVKDGPVPGPQMHQFVAGTAGAPFYEAGEYLGNNTGWKLKRIKNIPNTYGYIVVEISGNRATLTFKGRTGPGMYTAMDVFSYVVPIGS